jgi:hypothetical protein
MFEAGEEDVGNSKSDEVVVEGSGDPSRECVVTEGCVVDPCRGWQKDV